MGTEGGEDTQDDRLKPGCGLADQAEMMNCKQKGKNQINQIIQEMTKTRRPQNETCGPQKKTPHVGLQ